jgi:hypothetical protein
VGGPTEREEATVECEVCGHESEDAFEVVRHVGRHTFDTFECAIYALAPQCANCGVRVMGHGVIEDDHTFCCTHCAEAGPRKEAKPGKGDSGAVSDNGHSDHGDAHADAGSDDDDSASDDDDADDDNDSDDDGAEDDDDSDDGSDEDDDSGDSDEDDEDDEEKKLEKLEERISQARQNSDDLLSGPEDEADQDDADADADAEPETEEEGETDVKGNRDDDNKDDEDEDKDG